MKCLHCKKNFSYVLNVQSGTVFYSLNKRGNYSLAGGFATDGKQNDFCCPNCYEHLFKSEEEALKALNEKV